jgi:molybdenum cofactor cytidylyltransferase
VKTQLANVAGLILAPGQSKRMGYPKMTLAWGNTTIVGHIAQTLLQGGAMPVVVVTGGMQQEVEEALRGMPVSCVFNPEYKTGGMISSVRVGLQALDEQTSSVLLTLGDQPQIQTGTVQTLVREYHQCGAVLIVPSYQMRRGHPWLVGRELWQEIIDLQPTQTLRDFLEQRAAQIHYLKVDSDSVVQDIDTPEQYEQYRPK